MKPGLMVPPISPLVSSLWPLSSRASQQITAIVLTSAPLAKQQQRGLSWLLSGSFYPPGCARVGLAHGSTGLQALPSRASTGPAMQQGRAWETLPPRHMGTSLARPWCGGALINSRAAFSSTTDKVRWGAD